MYLLIHNFTIQNLEGIQMNALVERQDSIADGGIIGQTEVFLRRTRGRSGMTVPVGENLQIVLASIFQRRKLILWGEGEMLRRVVDVLHPVVLRYDVALLTANAQQVTACLVRGILPGLADQFIYNNLWNLHHLVVFEVAGGLFVIYQMVDSGVCAADGTRVTMLHGNRAELHGLGIEGE